MREENGRLLAAKEAEDDVLNTFAAPSMPPPEPRESIEVPDPSAVGPVEKPDHIEADQADAEVLQELVSLQEEGEEDAPLHDNSILPVASDSDISSTQIVSMPDNVNEFSVPLGVVHGSSSTAWDAVQGANQRNPDDSLNITNISDALQWKMALTFVLLYTSN